MQSDIYSSSTQQKSSLLKTNTAPSIGIAYIGNIFFEEIISASYSYSNYRIERYSSAADFMYQLNKASIVDIPYVILLEIEQEEATFELVKNLRASPLTSGAIIILLTEKDKTELQQKALAAKANDIYFKPLNANLIFERINFLIKFKLLKPHEAHELTPLQEYKMPVTKRLFDILVSSILIIGLLPFFVIVAIIIRLESKGPIIYKSKRAGTGYKIFDFYKFRSMFADADKRLAELSKTSNQYAAADEGQPKAFVKILNDPRVTKVGAILRKTSIDELPQLFNVLKGDMSVVGNRPLPLYEAEQLTSDQFAMRFLGPAGITGLWQISKRGKAEMSEDERKNLDNHYAKDSSFFMDLKIMLKTIPAMLQKEKV